MRGSIHAPRCRTLPSTAVDTAHALQACRSSLAPRSDNRPLSAHVPVNTSFRQASPDNLCCVHRHVVLVSSSLNTVYSEFFLSGFSVSFRCSWNHSRCSRRVVSVAPHGRWLKSHSFGTLNANLERPPVMWQPALLMHACIPL